MYCVEEEEEEEGLMFMTSRETSPVLTFPNLRKLKLTFLTLNFVIAF